MPRQKRSLFTCAAPSLAAVFIAALSGCQMMNGHASNNLGSGYYRDGNYAAAQRSFQQAVIDMPENPDFRYNLAATMQKRGDVAGAERIYRQTLHVDPSHQPSYHALAQLMVAQGRPMEAQALLGSWVGTQPYSAAPHIEMAWLQHQQGNSFAAGESLQAALKLEPNNPTALAQLGQMYQATGETELAAAYYERSLQGDWRQPEVQNRLASLRPNRSQQPAYGRTPTRMAGARTPIPLGWQPQGQFAQLPMPNPATLAAASSQMAPQPTFAQNPQALAEVQNPMTRQPTIAQNPPAFAPPQTQTALLPPQMAQGQFAMPAPMPFAGQPTPMDFPQSGQPTPVPTFATAPPDADPAHVPAVTAELPVVQPY